MKVKPKKFRPNFFLVNSDVIDKIIKCGILKITTMFIEVGPGTEIYQKLILKKPKNFFVIEKDEKLCNLLAEKFNDSLFIYNDDILSFKLNKQLFLT